MARTPSPSLYPLSSVLSQTGRPERNHHDWTHVPTVLNKLPNNWDEPLCKPTVFVIYRITFIEQLKTGWYKITTTMNSM